LTGYVQVLLEDYGSCLDEQGHGHLQALDRAARRMDNLTRDLLAYGRIARQAVKLEALRLEPIVDEIITLNGANGAQIKIQSGLSQVMAHRFLLEQTLSNLINNALKFVRRDSQPQVVIRTEPRGEQVRLWVEDNGIGIDPTYHRKIFSIFERVGDMQNYEGTGIGLAIVHRAVQRMGGVCGVESTPGEGSRFWVDLPAAGRPATAAVSWATNG
jgi:signal transduction histidine kinase